MGTILEGKAPESYFNLNDALRNFIISLLMRLKTIETFQSWKAHFWK